MNKHKAYWSVMGNEVSQKKSVKQLDLEKLETLLNTMFNKYNKDEILTLVRKVYEGTEWKNYF